MKYKLKKFKGYWLVIGKGKKLTYELTFTKKEKAERFIELDGFVRMYNPKEVEVDEIMKGRLS